MLSCEPISLIDTRTARRRSHEVAVLYEHGYTIGYWSSAMGSNLKGRVG